MDKQQQSYREFAEKMIRYFSRTLEPLDSSDSRKQGITLIEQWITLIDSAQPDPYCLSKLLIELEENQERGSAWYEIYLQVQSWAQSLTSFKSDY